MARNNAGLRGSPGPEYSTELETGGKTLLGEIRCFGKGCGEGGRSPVGAPTQVGKGP